MTAATSILAAFGLMILYSLGERSTMLLVAMGACAIIGWACSRREHALAQERTLTEHGIKRIRVGRDTIYVERRDDD